MNEYMNILGYKVEDSVTGFQGVVSSIAFDLYGCVQCVVTPEAKEGKLGESGWFDHKRLRILSTGPVMPVPAFETLKKEQGPAEKPAARYPR